MLQSQAADFEKDADGPGCRGSPYVATASVQTAPSSTKLRSLASAQSRSRENVARCRWKNTAACAQCAAQPPLRLRPPVEKCPSVEKQVSASGGRSSAWVIDCPPPHRGSAWICFTKWICFGRGSIFLSRHWIIDRWQSVCWHREKEARSVVAKELPLKRRPDLSSLSTLSSLSSLSTTVQPLKVKRALKWQKSKSMTCDCLVNSLELVLGHLQV